MKARYAGPAAPHQTNLKDKLWGNMSKKDFKNNGAGCGKQQKNFKSEPFMN